MNYRILYVFVTLANMSLFSMNKAAQEQEARAFAQEAREFADQEAQRRLAHEQNEPIKADLKKKYAQSISALEKSLNGTCTHYTLYLVQGSQVLLEGYQGALRALTSKIEDFDRASLAFLNASATVEVLRDDNNKLNEFCYQKQKAICKLEAQYRNNSQQLSTDSMLSIELGFLKGKILNILLYKK